MSPEWMTVVERMHAATHPKGMGPLSDPLERTEWQGLAWATRLFCWLSNIEGRLTATVLRPQAGRPARHSPLPGWAGDGGDARSASTP